MTTYTCKECGTTNVEPVTKTCSCNATIIANISATCAGSGGVK